MKTKGYALSILSAVSYGLIPLFILPLKAGPLSLNSILFYRFFISALVIWGALLYQKERLKVSRNELGLLITLGLLFSLGAECLFWSYDLLSPGIASTIFFVYPVIVSLIMAFFFKEPITRLTVILLCVTMTGIWIISTKDSVFDINFWGLAISMVGSLCYAVYIVLINKANIKASGLKLTFYTLLFSAAYYFLKVMLFERALVIPEMKTLVNITLFGLVTSVVSITALVYAVKEIGSTLTSIMGALEPVVAVGVSVSLFHEKLSYHLILGIVFILAGVTINVIVGGSPEVARDSA